MALWHENDYSFEDSDRFEEDSLCTWSSEPESSCVNWRGWKKSNEQSVTDDISEPRQEVQSLVELSAKCIAMYVPYELVEQEYPPVPEDLQLRIAYWSFPNNEDDIRLYSCLANSNSDEFLRGQNLYATNSVKDCVQIGFHLSGSVNHGLHRNPFNVAITFDRKKITACNCTCEPTSYWCSHVVAVCLHRINSPDEVCLRAPVSESLSRLERDQLQKFAQYLISELPQQILPAAQRLLDSLLSSSPSPINSSCGAPDPTAGASLYEQTTWFLDEKTLHSNIKKSLIKFCIPSPLVISDVNTLSQSVPPATAEWSNLLRPLRGREPEGLWNLLSIVREMFRRNDENALHLLDVLTEEAIACDQIMVWWFNTKVALQGGGFSGGIKQHPGPAGNTSTASHACALLCDEMVTLWRLSALNPSISPINKKKLKIKFNDWQEKLFSRVCGYLTKHWITYKSLNSYRQDTDMCVGFKSACEACDLDWEDYPLAGITYGTICSCDNGSCAHIKPLVTAAHLKEDHLNWNECDSSVNGNSSQIGLDECFLDISSSRHLHYGNRTQRPHYHSRSNVRMVCNVEVPNDENRQMTNVYWVQMPGSITQQLATTDENGRNGLDVVEPYILTNRPSNLNASTSSSLSTLSGTTVQTNSFPSSENHSSDEGERLVAQKSSPQTTPSDVDEYNFLYFYDPKNLPSTSSDSPKKTQDVKSFDPLQPSTSKTSTPIIPLVKLDAEWETMFSRAEGLYAFGHTNEACVLCVKLVDEFLKNPPNFIVELPTTIVKGKRKKINPIYHQLSTLASDILQKCYFLCSVLAERKEHYLHAFKIGLYGLEMPRLPASTKPLEVKMAHQEGEILNHLKRMLPLGKEQVNIIQSRAIILRDGLYNTRGESLLPLNLASFIFECLVMWQSPFQDKLSDESLGFEASVAALGMKANISEADHPLLCEGVRRQRADLATSILIRYKNNPTRLAMAMDKLLDREIHPFLQTAMDACWYQIRDPRNLPILAMKNVANNNILNQPLHCYNPNVTQVPGELDTNIAGMTLNPIPQTQSSCIMAPSSHRKDRYKAGKRIFPSLPNQASEANAHYLCELGKTILSKVGGPIQTTVFSQPPLPTQPHRALHMCAFQLSLYSLGLLNRVTPNWRVRNYSSQVTWIADHAMEIGAPATLFLLGTWEGHLTPTEVANMADRMSRSHERNTVEAAAQLALSCLKYSVALNPNEITRAIVQCKEQSDHLMEIACLTVEMAAKNGGVFPEVLFSIAKHWFDLYMRNTNPDEDNYVVQVDTREEFKYPYVYQTNYSVTVDTSQQPPPTPLYAHQLMVPPQTSPAHLYQLSYFPTQPIIQNIPPPNAQQTNTVMYYPYTPLPTSSQYPQFYSVQSPVQYQNANLQSQPQQGPPQYFVQSVNQCTSQIRTSPQQSQANICQPSNNRQIHHLSSAYRVGLLALDTLARHSHEPNQAKYSKNPPHKEDILWLLRLSKKLGPNYTQQFCLAVTNSMVNPFILHEVAVEALMYMGIFNPNPTMCPSLSPLIEKCHSMYVQLLHQKLYQLMPPDYDDYVNTICTAYAAFGMTPEGMVMFKDWLGNIKRTKSVKKELWTMIMNVLPPNT